MIAAAEGAWAAAVLCGGASRRMGQDKALLVVDGEPMVRRVTAAANVAGAATVITVGGDETGLRAALAGLDVRVVPDRHPGEGPLGGVLTALAELDEAIVLVLSCDLLAPDQRTMAATVAALASAAGMPEVGGGPTTASARRASEPGAAGRSSGTRDMAVPEVGGRGQWMHAAWRNTADLQRRLEAQFAAGERSVHRAVARSGLVVRRLPDVAPEALADADAPGDLRRHT